MNVLKYRSVVRSKYRRLCADHMFRRTLDTLPQAPLVSFTFDDFPRTALHVAGTMLRRYGFAGTYYTSLGLVGKLDASGEMFKEEDLRLLLDQGHELGCHTFSHCDSSETASGEFLNAIDANAVALQERFPQKTFTSFSFPKSAPRARTKQLVGRRFECCRGGGQTFNAGAIDLNYLRAFFLEQARGGMDEVKQMIDRNTEAKGWLIFATHDVCDQPSPYGCRPEFFADTVRYVAGAGARVLPVVEALRVLRGSDQESNQESAR